MPRAGGQYVYLYEAYGPLAGFLFGWILFFVSMSGAIAGTTVGFTEYLSVFIPALSPANKLFSSTVTIFQHGYTVSLSSGQVTAVVVIFLFSAFNYLGVGLGKAMQNIMTLTKIIVMAAFIVVGLALCRNPHPAQILSFTTGQESMSLGKLLMGFGVALISVSWAYDGWHNVNYIAGEIHNPKRNLPLALILGILIIIVLYMMVNVVYVLTLPIEQMRGVKTIAEKTTSVFLGNRSAQVISAVVMISCLGSINGAIFVGARVYYAMAKDGFFFRQVAQVHPRFKTPSWAILFQGIWSSVIALSGTYEQILTYVTFINLVFWITGTSSVFVLRKKYPLLPRPYQTLGYPWVPILFIISLVGILVNTVINKPWESLIGTVLMLIGIPVFFYWRRKQQRLTNNLA
jgi:APA family basic amino acid/polyamine antiporter